MSLGTNISRLRAEKRLSQGDLAEVLEVSRQSVSKWETDSSVPDLDKLIKLSQLFRVTLDELVTGEEPQLKVETPPVMVSPSMPGRKIAGIILFCTFPMNGLSWFFTSRHIRRYALHTRRRMLP